MRNLLKFANIQYDPIFNVFQAYSQCSITIILCNIEYEWLTEHNWFPTIRRREAEASWVDHWDNGEWKRAVGDVDAADAAIVFDFSCEEVLVADILAVDGGLDGCHLEHVFWGAFLDCTFLLFLAIDFVLDFAQVKFHRKACFCFFGFWSTNDLVNKSMLCII